MVDSRQKKPRPKPRASVMLPPGRRRAQGRATAGARAGVSVARTLRLGASQCLPLSARRSVADSTPLCRGLLVEPLDGPLREARVKRHAQIVAVDARFEGHRKAGSSIWACAGR